MKSDDQRGIREAAIDPWRDHDEPGGANCAKTLDGRWPRTSPKAWR